MALISNASARDYVKWSPVFQKEVTPIEGPTWDIGFKVAVADLKKWLITRMAWMDKQLAKELPSGSGGGAGKADSSVGGKAPSGGATGASPALSVLGQAP